MTREEMLLTSQLEALRELVKAMEKTIAAQKETIAALEKRVNDVQERIVYVPASIPQTQTVPYPQPYQQPYIGDPPSWLNGLTGGTTAVSNSIESSKVKTPFTNTSNQSKSGPTPFLSAFTIGVHHESRL